MKKLNRKGFTLIELLAVIVILAIVMVVTIPSVINAMNSARSGQLKNAADTVADWFSKNYELNNYSGALGSTVTNPADTNYTTFVASNPWTDNSGTAKTVSLCTGTAGSTTCDIITKAGITDADKNIESGYAKLVGNKICVTLTAASGGSFYVNGSTNQSQTSAGCETVSGS